MLGVSGARVIFFFVRGDARVVIVDGEGVRCARCQWRCMRHGGGQKKKRASSHRAFVHVVEEKERKKERKRVFYGKF